MIASFCTRTAGPASARQGPGEAQLVPVRVGDVEEALAPFGVARRRFRAAAARDNASIQPIHIVIVEDQPAPPRPLLFWWLQDQVEEIAADAKAREARCLPAEDGFEPEHAVESHGARHVVRREGDRADASDHRPTPFCRTDPARWLYLSP